MRPPAGYMAQARTGALEDEAMDAASKTLYSTTKKLAQQIVDGKSDCSVIPNYREAADLLGKGGDADLARKLFEKCAAVEAEQKKHEQAKAKTSPWVWIAGIAVAAYAIYRFAKTNP